jgi:hypothetical protein
MLFFLLGHPSFLRIFIPKEYPTICLSLEEAAVRTGHKVTVEVDHNIWTIVGDPQGILDGQLKPRLLHFLDIVI